MTKSDRALERVHNLYLLQTKLIDSLDGNLGDPVVRKEVRDNIRKFEELLKQADWRYMGGEDVLETLRTIPGTVNQKIRESAKLQMKKTVAQRETARRQKKMTKPVAKAKAKPKAKPKAKKAVKKMKTKKTKKAKSRR